MTAKKWLGMATGVVAIVLSSMSVAWACGNFASGDMTLANATDEPWDGGADLGANWSDCAIGRFLTNPHGCYRPVTVTGSNFENDVDTKAITSVRLWWLDEPYYAAGLGGPNGPAERLEGAVCESLGVSLGSSVTVSNKSFVATVNVAPRDSVTANGTLRIGATSATPTNAGKYHYGTNAVCATWDHFTSPTVSHLGSVGNSYNIFP